MQRKTAAPWLLVMLLAGLIFPAAAPAAPKTWSYADWTPGGQRTTLDGITFDSTIHCGNGHDFVKVADGHYRFRARVARRLYAWRFYFKIECPQAVGRTVTLEVADLNHGGRTPFQERANVYSTDGQHWIPVGEENVKIVPWTPTGHREIDRKYGDPGHVPYGVQFRLKLTAPVMWLAGPTPYTLDRLEQQFARLRKAHPKLVKVTTLGHSHHSRAHGYPIRMARITAPGDASKRENVFIMSGEHCSETAGIYACEGWMEEVLAHPDWLEEYVFYFVPIVNVDGMYYGATYYNMGPVLGEGIGQNISPNWPKLTEPETKAIWPVLLKLRPVFFASIHNGRHRRTMEIHGHAGRGTEVLMEHWRREVGLPIEGLRDHGSSTRCWGVLNSKAITRLAYTIEVLLLCRQKGFDDFQSSYIETGRQLARGTVVALDQLTPQDKQPALAQVAAKSGPKPKPKAKKKESSGNFEEGTISGLPALVGASPSREGQAVPGTPLSQVTQKSRKHRKAAAPKPVDRLRFNGDDFTAKLPWFYHGLRFEKWQEHNCYSFEANGLDLVAGDYTLAIVPKRVCEKLAISLDAKTYREIPVREGRAELANVAVRNRMVSFYVRADNVEGKGPLESVWVYPPSVALAEARDTASPFRRYRRNIRSGDREILQKENWDEFYAVLNRKGFGKKQLRAMFNRIVDWCKRRQVLDPENVHYGAIYSEEDKYCFRDAAAAAVCFTYAWRDTGDDDYRRRALLARNYCYKGQHVDPENKVRYGGFSHMIHGAWGPGMQRLGDELPGVVGVETCIIINLLVKTYELGLKPSPEDIKRLTLAAQYMADNEFRPGVFSHHEGASHDCQNSNALGVQAVVRAYYALEKLGRHPPKAWLAAARRGALHYLEGQEAIGCWPYTFANIGRGQAFCQHNLPDQGMGVYHWLVACELPAFRKLPGTQDAMKRAARWWLCTSRLDRSGPIPTIDLDDREARGTLKFAKFTWCRFMAAASLMRIAEMTDEKEPWRQLALRYMEHVDTKLRNETDPNKAPFKRATTDDMTLCSWIQAIEWAGVLLREIEQRLP